MPNLDTSIDGISKQMKSSEKKCLRLLQWNADGIKTKVGELEMRLKERDIDLAMIQESKLEKGQRTPHIKGYIAIREDRQGTRGGGLLNYVRDSLVYEIVDRRTKTATESLTIRIRMTRKKWITATNVYCPPKNSTGHTIQLDLNSIPVSPSSIICGDINAHSPVWDESQPEDARGEDVVEWACHKSLDILNDGSATRINKATEAGSSPDVTLCGSVWKSKCVWSVDDEDLGGSDHSAIIIVVNSATKHQSIFEKTPRWRSNGVNWSDFRNEIESEMDSLPETDDLNMRVNRFNDILLEAAYAHVRKVKPSKKSHSWMTPKCRRLIKERNQLRRKISTHRKEWLQACKDVTEAVQEAKTDQWKEVVNGAINNLDERKTWSFIKSLNGSPETNSPNEVLKLNGKRITSAKKKAELFAQHYAKVSKLQFTREERRKYKLRLNRLLYDDVNSEDELQSYPDFIMEELNRAIAQMKRRSAPGPDDIPPSFLKELGPLALKELLSICNLSLNQASCPQGWRRALIIPLLKAGKSPSEMASFRPISLTSCVVKVVERMHAERIYYLSEKNEWIADIQAGFRQGHSCTDQIIRVCQGIEDGFQQKPTFQRSVLCLLDYSKAYDTVWRERLLLSMADKGVPLRALRWIHGFLRNRQARVRLNGVTSKSQNFQQGLPQGAVLSPLLFMFFINNLAESLPNPDSQQLTSAKLIYSMFADDCTVLASHAKREKSNEAAQMIVDIVVKWSNEWKLTLNATKSEVCFFSTWVQEAKWQPVIQIEGKTIPFNPTPRLLGVYLDRQLTFNKHIEEVSKSATQKMKMIGAVSNAKWGWGKESLKKVYQMFVKSKIDYAAPAWQPWLSETSAKALDKIQNKALRLVSGQLKTTPTEALRYETRTEHYTTYTKRTCLKSVEMAKRLPDSHPRKKALDQAVKPKNTRKSWFRMGTSLADHLPPEAENRWPISLVRACPWETHGEIEIRTELRGVKSKGDDPKKVREAAEDVIKEVGADVTIFTDGSAAEGYHEGGAAAVVIRNDEPPRTEVIKTKGAFLTSSYDEECQAMMSAAQWIADNCHSGTNVLILTDSQSLCKGLLGNNSDLNDLRRKFSETTAIIRIQWIPSHVGIEGNEAADQAANEAREIEGNRRPITYRGVFPMIKKEIRDPPCRPKYQHLENVYSGYSKKREQSITCRWDQVELARLRSNHHWGLKWYQNFINEELNPRCRKCDHEREDVEHLFECPGTSAIRMELFGRVEVPLSIMTTEPKKSLTLARRFLRGVNHAH